MGPAQSHEPLKNRDDSSLVIKEEVRDSKQVVFDVPLLALRWERATCQGTVSGPHLITSKEMGTNHRGLNSTNNQSELAEPSDRHSVSQYLVTPCTGMPLTESETINCDVLSH